jgi:hypothetical protein
MAAEKRITRGKKLEDAAARKKDLSKMGILLIGAPRAEDVEGQGEVEICQCPWCGAIGFASCSIDDPAGWFRCGACGKSFQMHG